ncbi:hypothetical protein [Bacillus atrophaeus]|uniref:hypothetical protein n=1 Tax=Bacillus atrophaeus TaxID=1452 RepID=UPI00227F732D|nr:hypothetical protein [Bacillus atrophaeus]MCY8829869.1 hypothetical protein [Bacillus atrophaeus]MEC0833081.1 hypothetical protein [Bacillus atrophaeus]MEC0905838.1 hypothetical protein [Bacillus atrophaeus]
MLKENDPPSAIAYCSSKTFGSLTYSPFLLALTLDAFNVFKAVTFESAFAIVDILSMPFIQLLQE